MRQGSVRLSSFPGNGSEALQAAVDAGWCHIVADPGAVYQFPTGVLLFDRYGVTLDFTGAVLEITGVPSQTISGTGGAGNTTIKFDGCIDCHFVGGMIKGLDVLSAPIGMEGCAVSSIRNVKAITAGNDLAVFAFGGRGKMNAVRDCICDGSNGQSRFVWGGNVTAGNMQEDMSVTGCQVFDTGGTGISIQSDGFTVSDCIIRNAGGSGVAFSGATTMHARNGTISNITVIGGVGSGVQSDVVTGEDARTRNVSISNITAIGCGQNGVALSNMQDSAVSNVTCRDNGGSGVQIINSANLTIANVSAGDTREGAARTQQHGIDIRGNGGVGCENISVHGAQLMNHVQSGLQVATPTETDPVDGVDLIGVRARDNGAYGIAFLGLNGSILNSTMIGCTALGNEAKDIRVKQSDVLQGSNRYTTIQNT